MNLVVGDTVEWDAPQFKGGSGFGGRFRGAKLVETLRLKGVIERESYGKTGQHTFSIRLEDGSLKLVKGRNLYQHLVACTHGAGHDVHAAEKAERSQAAKERREAIGMARQVIR